MMQKIKILVGDDGVKKLFIIEIIYGNKLFIFYFIINYNLVHLIVLQQICIPLLGHVNFQITMIHITLLIVIHIHILIYK